MANIEKNILLHPYQKINKMVGRGAKDGRYPPPSALQAYAPAATDKSLAIFPISYLVVTTSAPRSDVAEQAYCHNECTL